MLESHTWNNLTVWKWTLVWFKKIYLRAICLQIIYVYYYICVNRIWYWITIKGWYAIKYNQPKLEICTCPVALIFIINKAWLQRFPWFSLAICPYWSSLLESPLDGIQCLHKPNWCKFLQVSQHWYIYMLIEHHLYVHPYFSGSVQHVLFILFGCFVRWEISDCIAIVLLSASSRISAKQHAQFLYSSHLAFSYGVLLKSK